MKLILALLVIVLYTIHALPTGDDDQATQERLQEIGPGASSRKTANDLATTTGGRHFGSSDSSTNTECALQCAGQVTEKTKRDPDLANLYNETTSMIFSRYNAETTNKFCTISDAYKVCLDRCQNSQVKTKLISWLNVGQYLCHGSNFKQNANCVSEVQKNAKATCDSRSKCGQYEVLPGTVGSLKDILKKSCQSMKCGLDCTKPTVISKCGQSAQNDMQGYTGKFVESLKPIVQPSDLPRECENLIAA